MKLDRPPLTAAEACAATGLTRKQIRRQIDSGRLKARWISRRQFQCEPEWVEEWRGTTKVKAPDRRRRMEVAS